MGELRNIWFYKHGRYAGLKFNRPSNKQKEKAIEHINSKYSDILKATGNKKIVNEIRLKFKSNKLLLKFYNEIFEQYGKGD
jgi:hypothetical protein